MNTQQRRLPALDDETAFFWTSGADGVLRIQRCADCGNWQHPPSPRCTCCASQAVHPEATAGTGCIVTFTINHQKWTAAMEVPFVFAAIELDEQEGLVVLANIDAPVDTIRSGMRVVVAFEQHDDVYLPLFRRQAAEAA